ncbi:MAG: hypothetical protein IT372_03850, partial [Polyangiaceae bacterium]|nr:hypothetical protein [Polyangiaceae bacterium]
NAVNPLFHIGMGGLATYQAIENDDYRAAGAAGVKTAIMTIATIAGAAGELKALSARAPAGAASSLRGPVTPGEAGRFGDFTSRNMVGDHLTPHHMPQAALKFTNRADGGALVMRQSEHELTRTFGGKGLATARADAGLSFREALARDVRDVRRIVGTRYDQKIRDLLNYYYGNFPDLMKR